MPVKIPTKIEKKINRVMFHYRYNSESIARNQVRTLTRLELAYLLMYQHQAEEGLFFDAEGLEDFARFVINALHTK